MPTMKKNSKKVFLLGFDGCTFNVINPLLKQGKLPNFAKVIKNGVHAYLDSTIPPLTPVAWPGMYTGKLSGKTGVFDFTLPTGKFDKKKNQSGKQRVNSSFIKTKTIWELLSEEGKKSIVLDVPLSYPPTKIDGIMISRVMSTQQTKTVYPKELYSVLKKKGLIYKKKKAKNKEDVVDEHDQIKKNQKQKKELTPKEKRLAKKENFQALLDAIDDKVKLIKHLNDNYQWDFFMAVFMESDQVGHGHWKDQKKVEKVYRKLDWALGEIFSFLPQESLKLIASDHGFKSIKGYFCMDEWLLKNGYAKKTFQLDEQSTKLVKKFKDFKQPLHKKVGQAIGDFKYHLW